MDIVKKRAGLLFVAVSSKRILLIFENNKWTIPSFIKQHSIFKDSQEIFKDYNQGKVVPVELYISNDKGFEFGTYACLVPEEFIDKKAQTYAWASLNNLPSNLHIGLKNTLSNINVIEKINDIINHDQQQQ